MIARFSGFVASTVVSVTYLLLATTCHATNMTPFELRTSASDAIVLGSIEGIKDTVIVTRILPNGHRAGRPETWLRIRVETLIKGRQIPTTIYAFVWSRELAEAQMLEPERHGIVFLRRHIILARGQDPIASSVPWILNGIDPDDAAFISSGAKGYREILDSVKRYVTMQSLPELTRHANIIVTGTISAINECPGKSTAVCITLNVDGYLSGAGPSRLTIQAPPIDIPTNRALWFLSRQSDGAIGLVGGRAGVRSRDADSETSEAEWLDAETRSVKEVLDASR